MAETVTILILGTGSTGASLGMALRRAGSSYHRLGYDPVAKTAQHALQTGAIDRVAQKLPSAAAEADLVILTLPPSQAREALETIAATLRPETVVLGTFRLQSSMMDSVRSALGGAHPYLAAVPFLGPGQALVAGAEPPPSADAFDGGMVAIIVPAGTPQGAIDICLDLASILKATPFFLEPAELDSVTATSEQLPGLVATATMASLAANPGWRDQRRLVGRSFARLVEMAEAEAPFELAREWTANRSALLARLEALSEEIAVLHDLLASEDEASLAAHLESTAARYREWRTVRGQSLPDHGIDLPGVPSVNMAGRLLGPHFTPKKK